MYYSLKYNTNKETVLITVIMVLHYTLYRNSKNFFQTKSKIKQSHSPALSQRKKQKVKLNKVIRQLYLKGKKQKVKTEILLPL